MKSSIKGFILFLFLSPTTAFVPSMPLGLSSRSTQYQPLPQRELSPRIHFLKLNSQVSNNVNSASHQITTPKAASSIDIGKFTQFALWYLGNYYYNISNKQALQAAGGATGFPMTLSCLQLGVGVMYALFLWFAPDARATPKISFNDVKRLLPIGICFAGAHTGSVFAMGAGAVSFAQIVKSAEPVFSAVIGTLFYSSSMSINRWLALIPVIGGVILASVHEVDFTWMSLLSAGVANTFASVKGHENKKLMADTDPSQSGIKQRLGSVGNQFAVTSIIAFLVTIPFAIVMEGNRFPEFLSLLKTSSKLRNNLLLSGLYFYGYNELATMTLKKTNAVTNSVANTAKRVIVILGVAAVMKESLDTMKLVGCFIAIAGVFLYSLLSPGH